MRAEGCREWRERLGAHALGLLSDEERTAVAAHLEGCAACRAEAEALAPLARLLALADPERLGPPPGPPPGMRERIEVAIATERRAVRRRRGLRAGLALAGAACAAVVVALAIGTSGDGERGGVARVVAFRELPAGIHVGARLEPRPWGSAVGVYVRGIQRGTLCRVYLRRVGGPWIAAGSFRYRYDRDGEGPLLTGALFPSQAVAVSIHAGGRIFLGRVEPPES
jgi:anti-sigma factor RsiW